MEVKTLQVGKVVKKPLVDLIAEHIHLSDTCSWYICTLGEELQKAEAENKQQVDFMALAKEEMDALQVEIKRLKKHYDKCPLVIGHHNVEKFYDEQNLKGD